MNKFIRLTWAGFALLIAIWIAYPALVAIAKLLSIAAAIIVVIGVIALIIRHYLGGGGGDRLLR